MLGTVEAYREAIGQSRVSEGESEPTVYKFSAEAHTAALRSRLPKARWRLLREEGRTTTIDEAVSSAMEQSETVRVGSDSR
jgi:hypothetical protein